jgi:hypothetical protein
MLARISSASLVQRSRTQIARFGVLSNCHLGNQIAEHIGGSGRGYLAVGGPLSSPGMAYWMVACSVYLYIAILGANVRICRISRNAPSQVASLLPEGMQASAGWHGCRV